MDKRDIVCPDCDADGLDRRHFLRTVGVTAAASPLLATAAETPATPAATAPSPTSQAETAVKALYESLSEDQKKAVCFAWDHTDKDRGLLRTYVSNNWQITKPHIRSEFFSRKQQGIIHDIFKGVINPEWYAKFLKQLKDDTGGAEWGAQQSIAIFGTPGSGKFEFVMTGRHMTLRADGNSTDHVAFGGPIFYGHAASGFNEKVHHPGNVFWHQAELANKVFQMLDDKQRKEALVDRRPGESAVAFRGQKPGYTGIAVRDLTKEQEAELLKVLSSLLDPFRMEDQEEARLCLKKQGGLHNCHLTFYKDGDIGNDGEWDNWRLEGPAFVWYFRGEPHVHVWVNIADDPTVATNAKG
jgi:hypothetical protein